ncbi:MAG: AAA family ATPase, partial [Desulfobacterales bacterium]|nr:AAA family ATPase [Desulfobacterales bacterium]
MHYYSLLDLNREPFSNSPDPGLFYGSAQHTEILQKLEIAIRLKRGLNLILGEVGTGKTTLSRRLIRQLGRDSRTDCHLILDPGFESVSEFLAHIQILLSGKEVQGNDSRQKEAIKDHLFTADREVNKITVLIIDEGQKMTGGALEALRELLNFETNREKLLQIVIFAQNEFKPMLDRHENLKDRINFHYSLKNLS